jgi:hypothetical protein
VDAAVEVCVGEGEESPVADGAGLDDGEEEGERLFPGDSLPGEPAPAPGEPAPAPGEPAPVPVPDGAPPGTDAMSAALWLFPCKVFGAL